MDTVKDNIINNINNINAEILQIQSNCKQKNSALLVAVTKTRSAEEINFALDGGVTDIGENKVQEIMDKYDYVGKVRWHMIGHLQTNKVKYIVDKVYMIHSVDTYKLAEEINKRAANIGIKMNILVQINPANEESKFGIDPSETFELIGEITNNLKNISVKGLMTIAPYSENAEDIRLYFKQVKEIYDNISANFEFGRDFEYLSMGMSNDFKVAIEEGSNMLRIGSSIFGKRNYF